MTDNIFEQSSCLTTLDDEVAVFRNFVYFVVGTTIVCFVPGRIAYQHFDENPGIAAKVCYLLALVNVLHFVLAIYNFPDCPQICDNACYTFSHVFIFPAIVLLGTSLFLFVMAGNRYERLTPEKSECKEDDEEDLMAYTIMDDTSLSGVEETHPQDATNSEEESVQKGVQGRSRSWIMLWSLDMLIVD